MAWNSDHFTTSPVGGWVGAGRIVVKTITGHRPSKTEWWQTQPV